jgi:PPK2 family polyphosphate:nucleotide phosphotransferase
MDRYRIQPGQTVNLSQRDPEDNSLFPIQKKEGKKILKELNKELEALQELLYAEGKQKILIVLQAMDAGGKDGTIRHVFEGVNPQGVKVASFKVPSKKEMAHDYLWRVHAQTPGKGEITIFNRSQYEDVLVVRVDQLVPETVWFRRYEHIRAFEKMLADEGTIILKFYLHISREEQKERFQDRLDEPDKNWKFSLGDLEKRGQWEQYIEAYQDVLGKTSTESAPWYVIPANRKWYRNLVISTIIINTLKNLEMEFPEPEDDLSGVVID